MCNCQAFRIGQVSISMRVGAGRSMLPASRYCGRVCWGCRVGVLGYMTLTFLASPFYGSVSDVEDLAYCVWVVIGLSFLTRPSRYCCRPFVALPLDRQPSRLWFPVISIFKIVTPSCTSPPPPPSSIECAPDTCCMSMTIVQPAQPQQQRSRRRGSWIRPACRSVAVAPSVAGSYLA